MATPEYQQQIPNPAPPSLSAGGHETHDYYAAQDASRPPSQQEPYLTPYLGLRARLSQTWINRWTILLLLVLIRTLFAIASLDRNLGTARQQALSMCTSVENVGSAMASMPHYLSQGVNQLTASGVARAINGLMQMLLLTVTGVEEIVKFIINLLTQTYVCLITMAVGGSLHVAIAVAEDVGNFLNATIQDVGKDLGGAATDFQNALNDFMADIDKIGSAFAGHSITPPTLDLSSEISRLSGVQLPPGYDQGLRTLNGSIPTFAQVNNFTNEVISFPFEELKTLLNASLPRYTVNASLFPVPDKQQLTFCSDNNGVSTFFDDLVDIGRFCKRIFLAVILFLATLAMVPMAYRECRRFRFQQMQSRLVRTDAHDPMDSVYIVSRPYTSWTGLKLANRYKSKRRQALVRWSVAYATTVPALFVLSLAIAGLLGCLTQYILLRSIEKEVPVLENQVIDFADKVINELNSASEQWAHGTNRLISDTNDMINRDVLEWVNTSTTAVNNTLNVFVNDTMDVLNKTFGGTVLYEPILDVLNCLVLLKIKGIEDGLTWVSDHAYIEFPSLPNDTFSLGTITTVAGSQADILNTSPNGTVANDISAAVNFVTDTLQNAIRQEAIISTCVLLIWVLIALIGCGRALFLMFEGGDDGVYVGERPTSQGSPTRPEKYQPDSIYNAPTPVYEANAGDLQSGDNEANRFNGFAYTLKPNPVPTFELNNPTSPTIVTGFSSPREGKLGNVGGFNVDSAIRRPTHIRASSHGDFRLISPQMASLSQNPFLSVDEKKSNPFADPAR